MSEEYRNNKNEEDTSYNYSSDNADDYAEPVGDYLDEKDPADDLPKKYRPITTGGYVGIFLLLAIPGLGLLLDIIWACGGCRKVSKKNMARAVLILWLALALITLAVLAGAVLVFGMDSVGEWFGRLFELFSFLKIKS